jgi:hypothetical protein
VVEHLPHHLKVKGSSPYRTVSTRRKKKAKVWSN